MKTRTNSIGIPFVPIPAGTFLMGDKRLAPPVHKVTLSSFWMSQYEITNRQFEMFKRRPRPPESTSDSQPVTRVNWYEAVDFCKWLSKKEGQLYRLPTEAEWEYAARGGLNQGLYPWGDSPYWTGRATFGVIKTTPVGSYAPNAYGLYDMAGNVSEWVSDLYDPGYYAHSPALNPQGPPMPKDTSDLEHILRGGFFALLEGGCAMQMVWADSIKPTIATFNDPNQHDGSGFRIAITAFK